MQIIVISDRLAKAKTVTLTTRHLFASALFGGVMLAGLTISLYALTFRLAGDVKIPFLHDIVVAAQQGETQKASEFVQQNLNAMAVKLGEMQAQLTRLDALANRGIQAVAKFQRYLRSPRAKQNAARRYRPQNVNVTNDPNDPNDPNGQ